LNWRNRIETHYRAVWDIDGIPCHFSEGPIYQLPADFSVMRYPPHGDRQMWTYATCCMSLPDDHKPVELHMFSPYPSDHVVELLVVTAHFHRTGRKLDISHSVNFGRPWLNGSNCDHGLISFPYLDGPSLENLKIESSLIKFYWLIPVTASEVEFKKQNGIESLENLFEKSRFNYLDPLRPGVI
jgi:Suppressor of fused protein (SUFU)